MTKRTLRNTANNDFVTGQNNALNYIIVSIVFVIILWLLANWTDITQSIIKAREYKKAKEKDNDIPDIVTPDIKIIEKVRRNIPFSSSGIMPTNYTPLESVKALQRELYRVGFEVGTFDGYYGGQTDGALKEFYRLKRQSFNSRFTTQEHLAEVQKSDYL